MREKTQIFHLTYIQVILTDSCLPFFPVYHIKKDGWVKISEQDCKDLHYKYAEETKTA